MISLSNSVYLFFRQEKATKAGRINTTKLATFKNEFHKHIFFIWPRGMENLKCLNY